MKVRKRKFAVLLLAFSVLLSTLTGFQVSAEEPDGTDSTDAAVVQNTEEADAADDGSETPVQDGETPYADSLINYVLVGVNDLQAPAEQNILLSFGDGSEEISSAKIIVKDADGNESEIPLTQRQDDAFCFSKTYEESETGVYSLDRFVYEVNGQEASVNLEAIGVSAQFGVNQEAAEDGIALLSESDGEDLEMDVTALTSDEIPDSTTADVEEVISNVIEGSISFAAANARTGSSGNYVVVLDPGHGGTEVGSLGANSGIPGNNLVEKDLNLRVAKYCKAELEKYNGITVYMTRDNDVNVGLTERVQYAKSKNANLFVSIHMNSATVNSANGAEVYYPNANYNSAVHTEGAKLAQQIQNQLKALGLYDRGIKYRNSTDDSTYPDGSLTDYYSVIRDSKRNGFPGIIVEHAFVSNESDMKKLQDESFLQRLGQADAIGIVNYLNGTSSTGSAYDAIFDFDYYINKYPDIKKAYRNDSAGALQHFLSFGMKEKRQGCQDFNVIYYRNRYPDLRLAFENDYPSYYMHYLNSGLREGRNGRTSANLTPVTVYNGVDYKDVYNYDYYMKKYSDLKKVYEDNDAGALKHFVEFGMPEGRQASAEFNVKEYRSNYADLRAVFGSNLRSYYLHYINNGKSEGRKGTSSSSGGSSGGAYVSIYRGVDYASVYDLDYYVANNQDVKKAYDSDPEKTLEHFVLCGIKEGRVAHKSFNVQTYRNKYQDLRVAFGKNWPAYFDHYMNFGKSEGRTASGTASLTNPLTKYNGVDYSPVYDFNYYIGLYPDLEKAFLDDDVEALKHFVLCGIKEGRKASEKFDIEAYKNNYDDLRKAFGNNNAAYVNHYLEFGINEKRDATTYQRYMIMGNSTTTVDQMVKYYSSKASYPAFYNQNDKEAKTIRDFCRIYDEECKAEGVKTEVAFCQAMKETGFLTFRGDVEIKQYNFAGLGATGAGAKGASFNTVREGIRAQVQHLKAYASTDSLKSACVDPRFQFVKRGSAIYVEWLGTQENPDKVGWATAKDYGYSIVNDYIKDLKKYN